MNMHSAIQKFVYICMFVYTFIQQGCINWSKVTVHTFIVLEININIKKYISNKSCPFELSIHQIKKSRITTVFKIDNK